MLGPNQRCRYEPVAAIPNHLNLALYLFLTKANKTFKDAEYLLNMLPKFKTGINQYKLNLQRGVTSGMVRSIDECKDGIECMKQKYFSIFTTRTPDEVLFWPGVRYRVSKFVSSVPIQDLSQWITKYGNNMSESLFEGVVRFVGSPMVSLFDYLEGGHMGHCVPSNVSSGLGTRPVDYIFINGTRTSIQTGQTLDGREMIMEGRQAYAGVLSYFTSTNYTPGK